MDSGVPLRNEPSPEPDETTLFGRASPEKAAAINKAQNPELKEKQIHQKAEVAKIDILDTRKINDGSGKSYEAVSVWAEGNLVRTSTVNKLEFCEPVKFQNQR